jgi:hypothetical protein
MVAHYCSVCDNAIIEGEDYIKNCMGDYAHYDCVTNMSYKGMLEWAGCQIGEMESEGNFDDEY